jgi:hypothetical protein
MDINVSADEMIDELTSQLAQLHVQLAAQQILIRKLQNGQAHSQEEEQPLNGTVRNSKPEKVSHQ